MYHNVIYPTVNEALPDLLRRLETAPEIGSRAGVTRELMHIGITLEQPARRELLVPGRKHNLAAQIAETAWVLTGRDDVEFLGHYLPRAGEFSDDGKTWRAGYGPRLRDWRSDAFTDNVDQLAEIVRILKDDPSSRRAVASIWDPASDLVESKDIPCNDWLSFSSRLGALDLHVGVRSNDVMWGWSGINTFEWSALQEVVAGLLGLRVGALHFSTTSFHIYRRHWEKAAELIRSDEMSWPVPRPADSPRFKLNGGLEEFDNVLGNWFGIEEMIREGDPAAGELVNLFPEPMLQSWLRVLQWWWSGESAYLEPLEGTALQVSAGLAVQPPSRGQGELELRPEVTVDVSEENPERIPPTGAVDLTPRMPEQRAPVEDGFPSTPSPFLMYATKLHLEKDAAYGDSWKRRGELFGIMANIARKVDRLGKSDDNETSADTALDLMVYLAKYGVWLNLPDAPAETANQVLLALEQEIDPTIGDHALPPAELERLLVDMFEFLESGVTNTGPNVQQWKVAHVNNNMLPRAYTLARKLWEAENGDQYRGADHA